MSGLRGQISVIGHISRSESADRFLELSHGYFSRVRVVIVGTGESAPPLSDKKGPLSGGFFVWRALDLWRCLGLEGLAASSAGRSQERCQVYFSYMC